MSWYPVVASKVRLSGFQTRTALLWLSAEEDRLLKEDSMAAGHRAQALRLPLVAGSLKAQISTANWLLDQV